AYAASCAICSNLIAIFCSSTPPRARPTLFPYTTLFRSPGTPVGQPAGAQRGGEAPESGRDISQHILHGFGALLMSFADGEFDLRSEEHTSELQSRENLVCRLLLEKKKAGSPAKRQKHGY